MGLVAFVHIIKHVNLGFLIINIEPFLPFIRLINIECRLWMAHSYASVDYKLS